MRNWDGNSCNKSLGGNSETFLLTTKICRFTAVKTALCAAKKSGCRIILSGPILDEEFFRTCLSEHGEQLLYKGTFNESKVADTLRYATGIIIDNGFKDYSGSTTKDAILLEETSKQNDLQCPSSELLWTKGSSNSLARAMIKAIKLKSFAGNIRRDEKAA